jgi:hypothetical protein
MSMPFSDILHGFGNRVVVVKVARNPFYVRRQGAGLIYMTCQRVHGAPAASELFTSKQLSSVFDT